MPRTTAAARRAKRKARRRTPATSSEERKAPRRARRKPAVRKVSDAVPIDVSVVDKNGEPITDLTAKDFSVTVAGKSRTIQSARFVSTGRAAALSERRVAAAREAGATANQTDDGRLVLF